jgi:hypothetical protein
MTDTLKPTIIINETNELDTLSTNILNLSLENNKQVFFKLDIKKNNESNIMLKNKNKRSIDNTDYYNNKKYKLIF